MNGSVTNGSASVESFDDLPSIVAFDDLFREKFSPFKQLSSTIGGDVQSIVIDSLKKMILFKYSYI